MMGTMAVRGTRGGPLATRAAAAFSLLIFMALATQIGAAAASPYEPQYQLMTVYEDGAVRVYSELLVDPLYPSVDIPLLGDAYQDVVVTGPSGIPLGYSTFAGGVSVNTLGEVEVAVAYTTHDITAKSGKYWSINFTSDIPTWMAFPSGASIVSLSAIPEAIDTSGVRALLLMPPGRTAITYVLSIVGTPDHAFLAISDAESAINGITAAGINVSSAGELLAEARDAFAFGNYAAAEELAVDAKSLALQTNLTAYQASAMIAKARDAILKAESEGRTVGIEDARRLLSQASSFYSAGDYASALSSAADANAKAESALTAVQAYALYIAAAVVAVSAITIVALLMVRGRRASKGYIKEIHEVDLVRIAGEKQLREEEFRLIEVLAENGGEAFESSVREKFDLPKTTIWRMVKRLEKEGYISVEKVAGQNLLKVRPEYLKK